MGPAGAAGHAARAVVLVGQGDRGGGMGAGDISSALGGGLREAEGLAERVDQNGEDTVETDADAERAGLASKASRL